MKKITLLITALISTIGFSQNLLSVGDFENADTSAGGQATGLLTTTSTPWSTSMTATARPGINSNSAVAHAGDRFMNVPNDFMSFRHPFTAVAGTAYTLKFWNQFVAPGGQPAASDGIYVSIRIPGGTNNNGTQFTPVIQFYLDPSTTNANWNEFTLNFTAPQSDLLLYVSKQARVPNTNPNNACRMDDFSIVAAPLSTSDFGSLKFNIYPNPAKDIVIVNAVENIKKIEIFNILGQRMIASDFSAHNAQINVSNLSQGTYLIKTYTDNAVGTKKFIKQ